MDLLSTSIIHDLRSPLGAVYAAAEILMSLDPGPTQVNRLATNIFRAAARMRELLADLNVIAREGKPTAEMCDIREVIAAASDAASAITKSGNVQILLNVSKGIELPLMRSRMERVFFNLVANALEAMPAGGMVDISCWKANSHVLIALEDTGAWNPQRDSRPVVQTVCHSGQTGRTRAWADPFPSDRFGPRRRHLDGVGPRCSLCYPPSSAIALDAQSLYVISVFFPQASPTQTATLKLNPSRPC